VYNVHITKEIRYSLLEKLISSFLYDLFGKDVTRREKLKLYSANTVRHNIIMIIMCALLDLNVKTIIITTTVGRGAELSTS